MTRALATLLLCAAAILAALSALQSSKALVELQRAGIAAQSQALPPGCVIAYTPKQVGDTPVLVPVRVCDKRHKTT